MSTDQLEEGYDCPKMDCDGTMGYEDVVGCTCFISPPCSNCVDNPLVCLKCGWSLEDE